MQPHRDEEGEEDDEEEDEIDTTPEQMSEFMEQFDRLGLGMRDDTSMPLLHCDFLLAISSFTNPEV